MLSGSDACADSAVIPRISLLWLLMGWFTDFLAEYVSG